MEQTETVMRNLFLGVCIAPYRVDLYNHLYEHFNCDIYFLFKENLDIGFSLERTWKLAIFPERYLSTIKVGKRRFAYGLLSLIRQKKTEVIFVPEYSQVTVAVLLLRFIFRLKYKVVSICDDSINMLEGNDFTFAHKMMRRVIAPFVDNIILPDSRSTEWYKQHYNKGVWMPIITDDKRWRDALEEALPQSKKLFTKYALNKKKTLLFVGRLIALKNIESLVLSVSKLKEDVQLVIVGEGELKDDLQRYADSLNVNAIFAGKQTGLDLCAWYNVADVLVLPSYQEAFGAVTNEALLAGAKVAVSDRCGSACLVNSVNGTTFSPDDTVSMTDKLRELLKRIPLRESIVLRDSLMPFMFKDILNHSLREMG